MGYIAGVDIPRPERGCIDVQGIKGNEAINIEVWKTQLPEWLLVKVKESLAPSKDNKIELLAEKAMKGTPQSYEARKYCLLKYLMFQNNCL
jgi:hypothetical protein